MKTAIMIMARMKSKRLPGKVLMILKDKPVLQHIVERCKRTIVDDVIVLCTDDKEDLAIIKFCEEKKYSFFIGKGLDVITQMLEASEYYKVEIIVDITADCPLVDPSHINLLLHKFKKKKVFYASNLIPRTFPDGFDIQIYKRETLKIIDNIISKNNFQARRNCGWNIAKFVERKDMWTLMTSNVLSKPEIRLTLDTKEDYQLITKIFSNFKSNGFNFEDVLSFLQKNPELLKINKEVHSTTPGL